MKKLALPKPQGRGKIFYKPEKIICCCADREYTDIYIVTTDKPGYQKFASVPGNLARFERWLRKFGFQRINRNTVVNLDYVESYDNEDNCIYINLCPDCLGRIKLSNKWKVRFFNRLLINTAA